MSNKIINRPPLLAALCILSFIGNTIGFIGYFLASLFFEKTSEIIIQYSSWNSVEAISPYYFTIFMVLFALSLTGAIRIWKFHRDGLIIYTIAQLVQLFLPAIWIDWGAFSFASAITTGIFLIGYGINWKWLK